MIEVYVVQVAMCGGARESVSIHVFDDRKEAELTALRWRDMNHHARVSIWSM